MFHVKKTIEISASHRLNLGYESQCKKTHGHNWIITVYCKSENLNKYGMVVDFQQIKKVVNQLDHSHINELIQQPTAENIAKWILEKIQNCYKVEVQESIGNIAIYEV